MRGCRVAVANGAGAGAPSGNGGPRSTVEMQVPVTFDINSLLNQATGQVQIKVTKNDGDVIDMQFEVKKGA